MASLLTFLVLLSLGTEGFSISINDILGFGYRRLVESPESPRVVEVIRWRQSVCLTGTSGILPCLIGLQNSGDSDPSVLKTGIDNPKSISPFENIESNLNEDSDLLAKRKNRETLIPPRIYSPKIVERLSLDKMGSSTFDKPVNEGSSRGSRYLRVASKNRDQTIYKVKVIDSPIIAKLVAETCLPDIGIPICDEEKDNSDPSYRKPPKVDKPLKPSISIPVVSSGGSIELLQGEGTNDGENSQGVFGFLNRPNVIQIDKEPNVDQVLVVQPTSSPSIFAGINGLLPINQFPQFPLPGFFQIPGIPSLQQILYRPENDISDNQGILGVITGGQSSLNKPGIGPSTEKPGIFGGLFSSPSKPVNFDISKPNPIGLPSIFNGFGNVFNPVNRPLLIERPNEKPILVEKPVYVIERPAVLGIFDILQNPLTTQSGSSSTEQPDVLKDPIYVLQKPASNAPLFGTGLLPNWNLFNIAGVGTTTTTTTTEEPEIGHEGIFAPSYQFGYVDKIPVSVHDPLIDPRFPEEPKIPEKPIVKPLIDNEDSTISAGEIPENDDKGSPSSFSVSLINSEQGKKDLKESKGEGKNFVKKIDEKIIETDETVAVDLNEKILNFDESLSNVEFGEKKIGSEISEDKPVENKA